MTSRLLSRNDPALARHAPHFQLSLPTRQLQPVAVISTPSPATCCNDSSRARELSAPRRTQARFEASEIFPGLFLGSWLDADSVDELRRHNIKRVLNVAEECPVSSSCEQAMASGMVSVKKVDLRDHSDEDISRHFGDALAFMHEGIVRDEGVLVHCRHGVSRSATMILAYLMQYGVRDSSGKLQPMTYAEAFDYVKERRPRISPNLGFVLALHEVEKQAKL
uniref:protein-tyrosine-phosphatase n=1 Tax=Neobodo designis TaxID=312471 RepID=A0A7S1QPB8_NEODS